MHGNVWEWCADGLRDYEEGPALDPRGPGEGAEAHRAFRGGSWIDLARWARSAYRLAPPPGYAYHDLGFRLCLRSIGPGQGRPGGPAGRRPEGGRGLRLVPRRSPRPNRPPQGVGLQPSALRNGALILAASVDEPARPSGPLIIFGIAGKARQRCHAIDAQAMRRVTHSCVTFAPEISGFAAEPGRFCGRNQTHRGRAKNSQENLKASGNWQDPQMHHMAQMCAPCAPEISGFAAEIGRFWRRNQRPTRQCGEKPCSLNGLRTPHTLSHQRTEVTHGVRSPAFRKFAPVAGNSPENRKSGPEIRKLPVGSGARLAHATRGHQAGARKFA